MIGSFDFVSFDQQREHQKIINSFFESKTSKKLFGFSGEYFKTDYPIGEVGLTLLGGNEKDYNFYPKEIFLKENIEKFFLFLNENKIDNFKIPLLSLSGARLLKEKFEEVSDKFLIRVNLNSVSPIIDKGLFSKKASSYMRTVNQFKKIGGEFKEILFDDLVEELHRKRWGDNRSQGFFNYLKYMNEKGLSRGFGLYLEGKLVSYIQLIYAGNCVHYYYSIYDENVKGAGSAIINYAISVFMNDSNLRYFSFGRGSENYKHRWKTGLIENYELRGFLKN